MEYGLIGAKLGHSYSKIIHEAVCGYSYELHPLPTEKEAHAFMQAKAFKATKSTGSQGTGEKLMTVENVSLEQ